jgi:hypothetical protein
MAMSIVMYRGGISPLAIIYLGSHRIEEDTTNLPHDSSENKAHKLQKVDQWIILAP